MKKTIRALLAIALAAAFAAPSAFAKAKLSPETEARAREAAARAAEWLARNQQADGHWGMPDTPALTALAFWALQRTDAEKYAPRIDAGARFVLGYVQPDGSIFKRPEPGMRGGGLANYNTAVCLSALHSLGKAQSDPDILRAMQDARSYLAGTQYLDEGLYRGGIGYSPDQPAPHADLSNSHMVYEAMHLSQDIEDLRADGEAKVDLDWDAALEFLAQVQNLSDVNTNSWISTAADDQGGFIYRPGAVGGEAHRPQPPQPQHPPQPPRPAEPREIAPAADAAAPAARPVGPDGKPSFLPPPSAPVWAQNPRDGAPLPPWAHRHDAAQKAPEAAPDAKPAEEVAPAAEPAPAPVVETAAPASPRFPRRPEGASGVGDVAGDRPARPEGSVPAPGAGGHPAVVHPYGSMTYAGILSLIYAHVDADDPRVQAAREWTQRHWTLAENPGMGPEGLYYFFNTLSKCMAAMGDEFVTQPDGTTIPWREDLIRRLVALQRPDGSWVNDNNRWWEADPGLVTSYTLLAIASALE